MLLLHDAKSEDAIRNFFNECYELYIKVIASLGWDGMGMGIIHWQEGLW
jgi:hypothetical protein